LHARLFSYLDTQLLRLGGPNFSQIPINRPLTDVNDNFRDGFHQHAVHHGRTPYLPNTVGGGCPFLAAAEDGGYVHLPRQVEGVKIRDRGPDDVYAQATLFWNSMSAVEQDHIVDAYTFELGKVEVPGVVERMVARLALVDEGLARRVCFGLGLPGPKRPEEVGAPGRDPDADGSVPDATGGVDASPALAMVTENVYPIDGRVVHILANEGCDLAGIRVVRDELLAAGAIPHVIATHKGSISGGGRRRDDSLVVDRSFHTASSAEADAIVVAGGTGLTGNSVAMTYVQSAYRHFKPIAAWGDGAELLESAGIDTGAPGITLAERANKTFARGLIPSLGVHRHWERADPHPTLALAEEVV
jgi:catalase